jgi:acetyl esterase/lipase
MGKRTFVAVCVLALAALSCGGPRDVVVREDISYYDGPGRDPHKHVLDLYLPAEGRGWPVLIFIHGGSWRIGDKDSLLYPYAEVGKRFARRGVAVVVASYRLAPRYKFPAQPEDVARVVRWTHENVASYGGDPERVFLSGHSAGGHLAALVALDERYLAAEGVPPTALAGVVGISGVYDLELAYEDANWFLRRFVGRAVFGDDPAVLREASPVTYARADAPPFLLLYGDGDAEYIRRQPGPMAAALRAAGADVETAEVAGRNHYTIIYNLGKDDDPTTAAVLDFIDNGRAAPPGEGGSVTESP